MPQPLDLSRTQHNDLHQCQQQQQQQTPSNSHQQSAASRNKLDASVRTQSEEDDAGEESGGALDVAELYAAVKPHGNEPELMGDNPRLRPTLRPYQKRAAAWMVAREEACQVRCWVTATHCAASVIPSAHVHETGHRHILPCAATHHIFHCMLSHLFLPVSKSGPFSILVKVTWTKVTN